MGVNDIQLGICTCICERLWSREYQLTWTCIETICVLVFVKYLPFYSHKLSLYLQLETIASTKLCWSFIFFREKKQNQYNNQHIERGVLLYKYLGMANGTFIGGKTPSILLTPKKNVFLFAHFSLLHIIPPVMCHWENVTASQKLFFII